KESVEAVIAAKSLEDEDAQVRLAALLALSRMQPSNAAGKAIYDVHESPANRDRWLRDALIIAAARHDEGFIAAARAAGRLADQGANVEEKTGPNLLPNPSFEEVHNSFAQGWKI